MNSYSANVFSSIMRMAMQMCNRTPVDPCCSPPKLVPDPLR
ncbi:MAG: hypothetical protein U0175_01295 [Caldilineaceae bacterium]